MAANGRSRSRMAHPGTSKSVARRRRSSSQWGRIAHRGILRAIRSLEGGTPDLVHLYRARVLTVPARTVQLLGKKCAAKINETLLGFELQISYKRIHCPDRVTAEYLRFFAELGCRTVKIPFDPTVTADLLPGFDDFMTSLRAEINRRFPGDRPTQLYVLRRVSGHIRRELGAP